MCVTARYLASGALSPRARACDAVGRLALRLTGLALAAGALVGVLIGTGSVDGTDGLLALEVETKVDKKVDDEGWMDRHSPAVR